jgi:3-isopropylmalate dehydrogenase
LSAALMLRYSFQENEAANAIEAAVEATLASGLRTADLARSGEKSVSTVEMGNAIRERLG